MKDRVERYEQLKQCKRIELEGKYHQFIDEKDYDKAYNTLGELMEYKLIDLNDYRLKPNCKEISKRTIDKKHRFKNDLRTSSAYVTPWLYADLPTVINSTMKKCKSIERNVQGETTYAKVLPEIKIDVKMELQTTTGGMENCLEAIAETYKNETKTDFKLYNSIHEDAVANAVQLYKISASILVNYMYRELGYIVVFTGKDNKVNFSMLLKTSSFAKLNVSLEDAVDNFKKSISQALSSNCKVNLMLDYSKFFTKQKSDMAKIANECHTLRSKMDAVKREAEIEKEKQDKEKKEKLRAKREKEKQKAIEKAEKDKKVVS